jgi:hypothetical protein
MNKHDKRAANLQNSVWSEDCHSDIDFEKDQINRAIVHGRMDIVLLVSHLSSVNSQLSHIKWLLLIILVLLIIIASS